MPKKDEAFAITVQGKQGLGQMAVRRKSLQSPHLNALDTILGCIGKADMRASNGGKFTFSTLSVICSASESEITKCNEWKNKKVWAKKCLVGNSASDREEDSFKQATKKGKPDRDHMGVLMERRQQSRAQTDGATAGFLQQIHGL